MFGVISRAAPRRVAHPSLRLISQINKTPKEQQESTPDDSTAASSSSSSDSDTQSPPPPPPPTPPLDPPPPISQVPSLDFTASESPLQTTGARSSRSSPSLSSIEKRRQNTSRILGGLVLLGVVANTVYMGREWDEDEIKERNLATAGKEGAPELPSTRWGRTLHRYGLWSDVFFKPSWPTLLPPSQPPPLQKPYTLLISLDDLLITGLWSRQHGWRTAKRPGVDYFLAYISQFYEVVIFTTQHSYTAVPIVEGLDKYGFFIQYKLFREATSVVDGKVVKDLTYLNRDLSKVVAIDTDPDHVATHPENAIILPKWKGDPKDTGLIAMIPFLESIAIYKPPDVRPILSAYKDKNIPLEYAQKEAEAKALHVSEWEKRGKGKGGAGGLTFSSLFGTSSSPSSTKSPIPPTYLEQKRAEAQANYRDEQAYIAAHKAEFDELLAKDQAAQAGQMPGTLWEMLGGPKGAESEKKEGEGKEKVEEGEKKL